MVVARHLARVTYLQVTHGLPVTRSINCPKPSRKDPEKCHVRTVVGAGCQPTQDTSHIKDGLMITNDYHVFCVGKRKCQNKQSQKEWKGRTRAECFPKHPRSKAFFDIPQQKSQIDLQKNIRTQQKSVCFFSFSGSIWEELASLMSWCHPQKLASRWAGRVKLPEHGTMEMVWRPLPSAFDISPELEAW